MKPRCLIRSGPFLLSALFLLVFPAACTQQQSPGSVRQQAAQDRSEPQGAQEKSTPPARPRAPQSVRVTIPQGTEIRLTLNSSVSSSSSQAGDTFTARTTDPVVVGNRVAIPSGSTVQGQVSDVVPARKGLKEKEGAIALSFDKIVTPAGFSAPMSAGVSSVAPRSTKKTAGIIGGSAAGGALLGKILGGSTKDAAIGAVVGGAAGTGIAASTRGKDVEIPAGSRLTITLDQPLTIAVNP